ncbi:MAG TPA: alanine racemase [Bryobacteraceae bacterium]|nr:alanine racemase [Bryobacteraceae bacterium]
MMDLETPAIVVDLDVMERNLHRMAGYTREHGLRLRPHTKTHKIPEIARQQLDLGAAGLTVAKVGEAEVMLESSPADLLVEYPIVGAAKLGRLAAVAGQASVTVAVDSVAAADQLSAAARAAGVQFGVLAEADVGLGRVGVAPADVPAFARQLARMPNLVFHGISFFPGHISGVKEDDGRAMDVLSSVIEDMIAGLAKAGLTARVISGGNTPTAYHSHRLAGLNEIRPGTYVFNDRNTEVCGGCTIEDCAASVLVTVVSTAVPGRAIIDGGSKTFSSDPYQGPEPSFGHVMEAPEARFERMNEEHGFLAIDRAGRRFTVGERIRVIPNHVCPTVNLHDVVYGVRNDQVEQVWQVKGRGKLQ